MTDNEKKEIFAKAFYRFEQNVLNQVEDEALEQAMKACMAQADDARLETLRGLLK